MAVKHVVLTVIEGRTMGKNQHVVPTKNGWGVLGENNDRITEKIRYPERSDKESERNSY